MSDGKIHLRSIGFLSLLAILSLVFQGCSNPEEILEQKLAEAQEMLDSDQTNEAVAVLEELHERWPERLEVIEFLAFAHARNNNPSRSADAFMLASSLAPDRPELLLYAAQAREEAGKLDQAASHYRLYITDHFDDVAGWQALARLEEERGLHHDAIDAYLHVYRLRPSGGTAAEIGDLFLRLNNTAQAHHWFETSLEDSGETNPKALLGLLRISMEEESWERAEELVEILDKNHEGALDASSLAMARDELRRWRESVEELERIRLEQIAQAERREAEAEKRAEEERLALEQTEAEAEAKAAEEAAKLAALQQDEEAAELPEDEEEETEAEVEPNPYETLVAEAANFRDAGRYGSAARTYWEALSYDDSSAEIWFELSRAHAAAGAWNDAELTALEALRRDPDRQGYHLHYLNVIKETHPVRAYLRELERVHQKFPENPEVVLVLANTYARSQHSHQVAVRFYQLFLRIAPHDDRRPQVEQSIRRLTQL